ncbi:MAG: HypC/HybG/HupF family hydrogenase formation chaperone [Actinomycetota bacterium]
MTEARELPVIDPQSYGAVCAVVDGCLTCGDVAVPVTVVEEGDPDAICADDHGTRGSVGIELVAPVRAGERLLVHGGVAISRLQVERRQYADPEAVASATAWQQSGREEAVASATAGNLGQKE